MKTACARHVASVLLAFLILSGCLKRETPVQAGIRTQTLLVGNSYEPGSLDPHLAGSYAEGRVICALFEGLTFPDEHGRAVPAAAEHWDVSPDGLTYTFHLRPNLRWSNGEPVTADAFVFSIQRMLNPKLPTENAHMLWPLKGAKDFNKGTNSDFASVGAKTLDARTLRLELENPTAYFPALVGHWTWMPVHRATLERFSAVTSRTTKWTSPGNLVGNGPFTLVEWSPDARIVVKKNVHYWDAGSTRLNKIEFFPMVREVEERNFRARQLHVTWGLPAEKVATYRAQTPSQLRIEPGLGTTFVAFNVAVRPLNDPRVRRALGLALDRTAIARAVSSGTSTAAESFTPANCAGYSSRARMRCDVQLARRLLEESGFPGGKGLPVLPMLQFNLPGASLEGEAVQQMWLRELGVRVSIEKRDVKTMLQELLEKQYTIALTDWGGDFVDPAAFLETLVSDCRWNYTNWSNAEFDQLIAGAAKTTDPVARFEFFQQAERLLLEEAPIAPINHGSRVYLVHPAVKGWKPAVLIIHRLKDIFLDERPVTTASPDT